MVHLNNLALIFGWAFMVCGGLMLTAFFVYVPCNIAWKKFGDTAAFVKVMREARKQGVKVWR